MSTVPPTSFDLKYHRLPGRAKRSFGFFVNEKQRLYLGDDHLLAATNSYNYERYKRFYLADIQSLTVQKTGAGAVLNFILGVIAGLFGTLAVAGLVNQWDPAAQITLLIFGGLFLGLLLINTAFGPTCQCHILTAVNEEPLYCLGRLYTAQRVVEYLRAVVEGVQGTAGNIADTTAQRVERAADAREAAAMIRKDSGQLHFALFVVLIVDALLGTVFIFLRDSFPIWVSFVTNIVIVTLVIAAAIRQQDSDIPRAVRTPLWVALAFNMVLLSIGMYIAVIVQVMSQTPDAPGAQALQSGFLVVGNVVNLVFNLSTGAYGLHSLRIWRRAVSAQAEQHRIATEQGGGV